MDYKQELLKQLLINRELERLLEKEKKKFKRLQKWTQKKLTLAKALSCLFKKEKDD